MHFVRIPPFSAQTNCMAFMYDSCAANLKAIRTVTQIFYPGTAGIQCMSHLFSNTGMSNWTMVVTLLLVWTIRQ